MWNCLRGRFRRSRILVLRIGSLAAGVAALIGSCVSVVLGRVGTNVVI